jgi:hypothetical protein
VLNEEPGGRGALKPEDVVLIAGAGAAVAEAHREKFLTVGVTNRAQVARSRRPTMWSSLSKRDRFGHLEGASFAFHDLCASPPPGEHDLDKDMARGSSE